MVAGFDTWKVYTKAAREKHEEQVKIARFVSKMMMGGTAKVFERWTVFVEEAKRRRKVEKEEYVKLQRFAKRLRNKKALSCFLSWIDFVEWRQGSCELMVRVLSRIVSASMVAGFDTWKVYTKAAREKHEEQVKIARFVSKMMMGGTAKVFERWTVFVEEAKRQREIKNEEQVKLQRFAKRLRNKETLSCFLSWIDFVEWRQGSCELMVRVLSRIVSAS